VSAFNRVFVEQACPHCGAVIDRAYQFKYGDTWQYDYRLGDTLRWGGNDRGIRGLPSATTDGVPEQCISCGFDEDAVYVVRIENDVLVDVAGPTIVYPRLE
jgi:hypothetical protein